MKNYMWLSLGDVETKILVDFMVKQVNSDYISHGEVLDGRAVDFSTWSPNLSDVLANEFDSSYKEGVDKYTRISIYKEDNAMLGLALVEFDRNINTAILQDLIIDKDNRNKNAGRDFLGWIESELVKMNFDTMLLESGINNVSAHKFFERNDYHKCSVVMVKKLK